LAIANPRVTAGLKWAAEIGADGFSRNAIDALELAKTLMNKGTASA